MTRQCHSAPQITVISVQLWRFINYITYVHKRTHLDGVDVWQSITGPVTDENDWVSEGDCRWNRSKCRALVQSTRCYHTHL